jgi:hypothetical protein
MSGEAESEFVFDCPECGETLAVNGPMRDTLIEKGCVICSASVTPAAFSESSAPPS